MFPQELVDAVEYLNSVNIIASKRNRDGRVNSVDDEEYIVQLLTEQYKENNQEAEQRSWYDDRLFNHPLQIKSSDFTKGASDNFNAKLALLYAFTDMTEEEIIKVHRWSKFELSLATRRKDDNGRDYYIIVMDKSTGKVHLNSLKKLAKLTTNGNNLPFQIKWQDNIVPVERTPEEAYNFVISAYKESVHKKLNQHTLVDFL